MTGGFIFFKTETVSTSVPTQKGIVAKEVAHHDTIVIKAPKTTIYVKTT